MFVEMGPTTSIRPYENNPRLNDAAVDAVAASIREFDFRQPIVTDEAGVIIVGHTRYKAALKLGLEMVPIHVAKGLSPAQAKAYRLADNQTATQPGVSWRAGARPLPVPNGATLVIYEPEEKPASVGESGDARSPETESLRAPGGAAS